VSCVAARLCASPVVNGRQPQQLNAMTLMCKASQLPTDGLSSERCSAS